MKRIVSVLSCMLLLSGCTTESRVVKLPTDEVSSVSLPQQHTSGFHGDIMHEVGAAMRVSSTEYKDELSHWQSVNSDVAAMVHIEELGIREPIVAAQRDNKEWLRKNIYGEDDNAGCVFLDYRSELGVTSVNLLHGHNMKDNSMFGNVPELMKLASCDEAPLIKIGFEDGYAMYKIFSVMSVDATVETLPIDFMATSEDIFEMAADLQRRSLVPGGAPDCTDLLVLNTCWYGESGMERNLHCIVSACRVF